MSKFAFDFKLANLIMHDDLRSNLAVALATLDKDYGYLNDKQARACQKKDIKKVRKLIKIIMEGESVK